MLLEIIKEIDKALANEMFLSALSLTLTLPDICGKAEYPDEKKESVRYMSWYNKYIGDYIKPSETYNEDMPYSSGEVVYNLRCSLLHQGNPNLEVQKIREERCRVERFILSIDEETDCGSSSLSYGVQDGALVVRDRTLDINIVSFCKDMCIEAENYYRENKEKFIFFNYEIVDRRYEEDKRVLFEIPIVKKQ